MGNKKELYIIGAGGFGRETAWLVERINGRMPEWGLMGFIEQDTNVENTILSKYKIVGGEDHFNIVDHPVWVVCAVATANRRKEIIRRLKRNPNIRFATLIDPSVIFSSQVKIGEGCIICARTVFTINVTVGSHVIINLGCTVGHDTVIGDYVTVNPGANLSGNVVVGSCSELGTGMQVIQGRMIGEGSLVGAGAVVTTDIPGNCTAVGIPARPIKYFEDGQGKLE